VDETPKIKSIVWMGSSRRELKVFPAEVRDVMGYALYQAQLGLKAPSAKPLTGFGGANVLEIVEDFQKNLPRRIHREVFGVGVRDTCLSEEIKEGHSDTEN
jgi:phage-related protein